MSNPNWRTLLAASVMVAINPATLWATPPTDNTPAYRPISLGTFLRMVSAGRVIRGRLVPPDYIASVLTNADKNPPKQSPHALRLKFSKVTDGTIRPKSPTREQPDDEKSKGAVHLALPVDISNTEFDANLYLDDVVIDKSITLDNVDFRQSVYFPRAVFRKPLVLKRTHFRGITDFSHALLEDTTLTFTDCEFDFQANFAHLTIRSESWLSILGNHIAAPLNFYGSQIAGTLFLQGLEGTLEVDHAVYLNRVNSESGVPVGKLSLKDIVFHDNVYMDHSKWDQLDLAEFDEKGRHRPIRFLEFYDLSQGSFNKVDLSGVEFDRGGDFSGSVVQTVSLEGIKLRQPVQMTWDQLSGKLMPILSEQAYVELERNFKKLGDIDSQNDCNYERRWKYQGVSISFISWLLSGYWVVWWVPLLWLVGSLLAFYGINRKKFDQQQWFGLRKSAAAVHFIPEPWALTMQATFRLVLPKEYWGTAQGQRLYLLESLWLKVVVGVFIFTLKNTSPLLRDLLPYLLPK